MMISQSSFVVPPCTLLLITFVFVFCCDAQSQLSSHSLRSHRTTTSRSLGLVSEHQHSQRKVRSFPAPGPDSTLTSSEACLTKVSDKYCGITVWDNMTCEQVLEQKISFIAGDCCTLHDNIGDKDAGFPNCSLIVDGPNSFCEYEVKDQAGLFYNIYIHESNTGTCPRDDASHDIDLSSLIPDTDVPVLGTERAVCMKTKITECIQEQCTLYPYFRRTIMECVKTAPELVGKCTEMAWTIDQCRELYGLPPYALCENFEVIFNSGTLTGETCQSVRQGCGLVDATDTDACALVPPPPPQI